MGYIDAQLKMAAEAEVLVVAEGKRLDELESDLAEDGERLNDSAFAEHDRLTSICMKHYRLALHAAGLLPDRAVRAA